MSKAGPSFSQVVLREGRHTDPTFTPSGDLELGTAYDWRVRARDSTLRESVAGPWTFTTTFEPAPPPPEPPGDFSLVAPGHGRDPETRSPRFRWQPSLDAGSYTLMVATDSALTSTVVFVQGLPASRPSYDLSPSRFAEEQTYYWKVVAHNEHGQTDSRSAFSFHLADIYPPEGLELIRPAHGAEVPLQGASFEWSPAVDINGVEYELSIEHRDGSLWVTTRVPGLPTTTHTPAQPLLPGRDYRWQVDARDLLGNRASSGSWSFWTASDAAGPPSPFRLTSPEDGTDPGTRTPRFEWSAAAGADTYELQWAADPGFANLVLDIVGIGRGEVSYWARPTAVPTCAPYPFGRQYWRVFADNRAGRTRCDPAYRTFRLPVRYPLACLVLVHPPDGAISVPTQPAFEWSEAIDPYPVVYHLEVGRDRSLTNLVIDESGLTTSSFALSQPLLRGTTYVWRVTASDVAGSDSVSTATSSFQVEP